MTTTEIVCVDTVICRACAHVAIERPIFTPASSAQPAAASCVATLQSNSFVVVLHTPGLVVRSHPAAAAAW